MVAGDSRGAAGEQQQQQQRRRRQRGARRGGKGQQASAAERVAAAADENVLVETPAEASARMRTALAALFRRQGESTGSRFPLAASRIAVQPTFTPEQIWGQLSVLYAPVLKAAGENATKLSQDAAAEAKRSAGDADGDLDDDDDDVRDAMEEDEFDDEDDDGFESDVDSVDALVSSDDEVDALARRHQRGGGQRGKKGGRGGVDPDAWRYALGRPGEGDDDDDVDDVADDDDAELDPRRGGRDRGGDDDDRRDRKMAQQQANDDDDDELLDDADEEDFDGEEDEEGDVSEADSNAAMREIYGDDADADGDDGLMDDDDAFDDGEEDDGENMAGFLEERELEEDEEGAADDGAAGAASPFGPTAAPENPLDLSAIDRDPTLTSFEKEEKKRLMQVEQMEMERAHGKHWTMTGEVAASARPKDSLIDEVLDFEHALAPAPVVTEFFTSKLEERIKKRIADGHFDDVERKLMKTTPGDLETSKRDADLDAQKSKLSLVDLYEKEYLERQAASERAEGGPETAEPLTEIERDELKAVQLWKRLSQHLDALSNFFFTPKPVNPEVDARVRAIESQAPAITLEAVGMTAVAKDRVLAPQDVFRPKQGLHTDAANAELTPDERKAIRRAAKSRTKAAEGRKEKQQIAYKKENDKKKKGAGKKDASK